MLCTRDLCGALSGAGLMRVAASAWTAPSSLFRRFYVRHRTAHSVRRADKSSRPVSRVRPNSKEEKTNEQVRERFQTTDMAYGGGPRRLDRRMRRRHRRRDSRRFWYSWWRRSRTCRRRTCVGCRLLLRNRIYRRDNQYRRHDDQRRCGARQSNRYLQCRGGARRRGDGRFWSLRGRSSDPHRDGCHALVSGRHHRDQC